MKSKYLTVVLTIIASLLVEDSLYAKRTTKTTKGSSKRSGSSKKKNTTGSSKRSGSSKKKNTTGSSKRSASSQSGLKTKSSKRAASTNARRASATTANARRASAIAATAKKAAAAKTTTSTEEKKSVENPCPIGKLLKRGFDENGNEAYFKTKTATCNPPENTSEISWNMNDAEKLKQYTVKKSWISEDEAVAFECESGTLLYKNACESFENFCPLNEIIERSAEKKYINPYTGESCVIGNGVSAKKVTASENDSDIETGKAYRLSCPDNFYTNTENYVQCVACPSNKPYSTKGSNIGEKSCFAGTPTECEAGSWIGNGETECKPYASYEFTDMTIQDNGTLGYGLYEVVPSDASKCKDGTKTSPFTVNADAQAKFAKISSNSGSYFAINGEFVKTCEGSNVTFTLKKANGSEGLKDSGKQAESKTNTSK